MTSHKFSPKLSSIGRMSSDLRSAPQSLARSPKGNILEGSLHMSLDAILGDLVSPAVYVLR